jgi:hypothetical protein
MSISINVDVNVDIEDYMDEIDTDDLIEELSNRDLSAKNKKDIIDFTNEGTDKARSVQTIIDDLKFEAVLKNINSKTLEEIDQFFKN